MTAENRTGAYWLCISGHMKQLTCGKVYHARRPENAESRTILIKDDSGKCCWHLKKHFKRIGVDILFTPENK